MSSPPSPPISDGPAGLPPHTHNLLAGLLPARPSACPCPGAGAASGCCQRKAAPGATGGCRGLLLVQVGGGGDGRLRAQHLDADLPRRHAGWRGCSPLINGALEELAWRGGFLTRVFRNPAEAWASGSAGRCSRPGTRRWLLGHGMVFDRRPRRSSLGGAAALGLVLELDRLAHAARCSGWRIAHALTNHPRHSGCCSTATASPDAAYQP
jgi:hypothetical protein